MKEILLGKSISSPLQYSPLILFRVLRSLNRLQYDIEDNNLPFLGYDTWHCYLIGFLTSTGAPINCIGKIVYPCTSKYIVESKSLKLYLNSFNMEAVGNVVDSILYVKNVIVKDLSELLETTVLVSLVTPFNNLDKLQIDPLETKEQWTIHDYLQSTFDKYTESPELLRTCLDNTIKSYNIKIPYLRSNCKVTHQPDWGTAYISISSDKIYDVLDIYRYVASFRNENHFHELVCEMIYKRLLDAYKPKDLLVTCMYTRRGGIDICPLRTNNLEYFKNKFGLTLLDVNVVDKKTYNQ